MLFFLDRGRPGLVRQLGQEVEARPARQLGPRLRPGLPVMAEVIRVCIQFCKKIAYQTYAFPLGIPRETHSMYSQTQKSTLVLEIGK